MTGGIVTLQPDWRRLDEQHALGYHQRTPNRWCPACLAHTPIPYGGPVKRVPGSVVGDIQIAPDFGVGA
jgi:ribosome biogenesis protein Tsr3